MIGADGSIAIEHCLDLVGGSTDVIARIIAQGMGAKRCADQS
jgi:hypothetical protein